VSGLATLGVKGLTATLEENKSTAKGNER